jgi:hypothetical protein
MLFRLSLLWLPALLLTAGPAPAHTLFVRYQVLPGNRVQVSSFYRKNDVAALAIVNVYRANGQLLREAGVMDEKGVFIFSYQQAEDLKIVVLHDGHRGEKAIPANELTQAEPTASADRQSSIDEERIPVVEILAGIGLVMALAALYLSWRTSRRLDALEQAMPGVALAPTADSPATAGPGLTGIPRPAAPPTDPAPG